MLRCEGVSKKYVLGEYQGVFRFTEYLVRRFANRKCDPNPGREFWALQDISFDLEQGQALGLIGRNGAGKSTLLKLLSRITYPTRGSFYYNGRLASLLEVGMGFKQELTGRENIFLSGSILGLRHYEIRNKLEQIIDFAEIERFIDTPVKRYSSGMFVRLAFAVAAHLEPDILLVDEVLAVGDQKFQKKCLRQMSEVTQQGRTVIFVSHNLQSVSQLCGKALLLEEGKLVAEGEVGQVIETYAERSLEQVETLAERSFPALSDRTACLRRIAIRSKGGKNQLRFDILDPICFEVEYQVHDPMDDVKVVLYFNTLDGIPLFSSFSLDWSNYSRSEKQQLSPRDAGTYVVRGEIPAPVMNSGHYEIQFYLGSSHDLHVDMKESIAIEITDLKGSFASVVTGTRSSGLLALPVKWEDADA